MEVDDVIKKAFDDETLSLELSEDTCNKMLDFIESSSQVNKVKFDFGILQKFRAVIQRLRIIDILEVVVFALVLILVPLVVNQHSFKGNLVIDDSAILIKEYQGESSGIFVDRIRKIINGISKQMDLNIVNPVAYKNDEVYTTLSDINEKSPFKVEYPSYVPEGYKLDKTELHITSYDKIRSGKDYQINIVYTNNMNEILKIILRNAEDPSMLRIVSGEKISLNGLDAIIADNGLANDDSEELDFWTKNMTYFISSTDDNFREELIKVAKSFKEISEPDNWTDEKHELYYMVNEFKYIVPYDIQFPKGLPEGYSLGGSRLDIYSKASSELHVVSLEYFAGETNNFILSIANEPLKPEEILKKCRRVMAGNLEVWVYPSESNMAYNQIMFWKKGLYYNISSSNLNTDTLIKIAKSYDNSNLSETAQNDINPDANAISTKDINGISLNEEVKGQGIIFTLSPKKAGDGNTYLGYLDIHYLLGIFWENSAQAISVNGIRVSSQADIKKGLYRDGVLIDGKKLLAKDEIIFYVIGDKSKLSTRLEYPGTFNHGEINTFDIKIEKSDSIIIPKQ